MPLPVSGSIKHTEIWVEKNGISHLLDDISEQPQLCSCLITEWFLYTKKIVWWHWHYPLVGTRNCFPEPEMPWHNQTWSSTLAPIATPPRCFWKRCGKKKKKYSVDWVIFNCSLFLLEGKSMRTHFPGECTHILGAQLRTHLHCGFQPEDFGVQMMKQPASLCRSPAACRHVQTQQGRPEMNFFYLFMLWWARLMQMPVIVNAVNH